MLVDFCWLGIFSCLFQEELEAVFTTKKRHKLIKRRPKEGNYHCSPRDLEGEGTQHSSMVTINPPTQQHFHLPPAIFPLYREWQDVGDVLFLDFGDCYSICLIIFHYLYVLCTFPYLSIFKKSFKNIWYNNVLNDASLHF